jgi:hypothetical protein
MVTSCSQGSSRCANQSANEESGSNWSIPASLWHPASSSFAAASASRSEPEYAAQSPVDFVHEGSRRVADRFLKVSLIEGDEGGDVDD